MRIKTFFATLLCAALAACGGGEKRAAGGGAADKNTLVIALKSSPTNLDSRVGNDNASGRVHELIYSALLQVTPQMDYTPDLATKWDTPDDKTIIFHLKPGVKFQDGRPLTAKDVKWTYDSVMDAKFVTPKKSGYAAVDHIEAPDDQTVIFRLKEPNPGIFDNLNLGIVPTGSDTTVFKTKPIGAGPYRVVEFRPDERLVLEAFDGWHEGAPKIKHVTVRIIPDATTMVLEMRRGTVNFEINQIPFENVAEFEKSSDFKVVKTPGSVYQYLAFNMRDPILAKREVRQAIAYAIDRGRIVRDIQRGYATPTDSMFALGHWARPDNLPTYPYDPAKAKQLLQKAGYGSGVKLLFKTSTDAEANSRAEVIQQMLKDVGITMQIQSNETSTFLADIQKGNFQLYSFSRNGIQDPDFYYIIFFSKNIPPEGQNRGFYNNPRVDQLILQGRSTFDRAKRKPIYAEIQRIAQEDLPYVSLYLQTNVTIMRNNIDGYVQYPAGFWLSIPKMSMH